MFYRLGWSITRLDQTNDGWVISSLCAGYTDFKNEADMQTFENGMRTAHDQNHYDVRTWRCEVK